MPGVCTMKRGQRRRPDAKRSARRLRKSNAKRTDGQRRKPDAKRAARRLRKRIIALMLIACIALAIVCARSVSLGGLLEMLGYPESLIVKLERYPETVWYVLEYPFHVGEPESVDVSADIVPGEIPLFLQWDSRWGYADYGGDMIGVNACGPTSLSMVCCGLTGEARWNPLEVARFADRSGYYIPGSGSSWALMEDGARQLGLNPRQVDLNSGAVIGELRAGRPVICSMKPGDFTYTGHFIVLTGVDESENVSVNDCNSLANSSHTWNMERILAQAKMAWSYSVG